MSIYDKIRANTYKNTLLYPSKPKEPAVLRKIARDLTKEERDSLDQVSAAYMEAYANYKNSVDEYHREDGRLANLFQNDLEDEYGMTGHPKAALLYSKAYDKGHSGGFEEVASYYDDLVDLVK